jgi:hypothetical protein
MPKERLTLRKIREILRLRWGYQLSERVVARSCGISLSWLLESSVGFLIVKHAEVVTKMEYHAVLSLSSSKLRRA